MTERQAELWREGIRLFNEQEFFACHDVLEELWSEELGPDRTLTQGLIQAAVSLFHLSEGNLGGARKMYRSVVTYLTPFAPHCRGLQVGQFLADYELCFAPLLQQSEYPVGLPLTSWMIPRLQCSEMSS